MPWLPPKSLPEREKWAKAQPWIAGIYFGLLFWAVFPLLALLDSRMSLKSAYLFGLAMWPVTVVLFAVGLKHRWGVRADAPSAATGKWKFWREPWRSASDRFLFWFQWLGIAGIAASIGEFFGAKVHPARAAVGLGCACWVACTTWLERRRRKRRTEIGS
jgi:hypothetical protein